MGKGRKVNGRKERESDGLMRSQANNNNNNSSKSRNNNMGLITVEVVKQHICEFSYIYFFS